MCTDDECTNKAHKGGVCIRHGAKLKRCSCEGCTNRALRQGVCVKQGAKWTKKKCSIEGCASYAIKGGVCMKHGTKRKQCSSEGCTSYAKKGGVCVSTTVQRSNDAGGKSIQMVRRMEECAWSTWSKDQTMPNAALKLKDVQTCPPRRSLHRARGISQHERWIHYIWIRTRTDYCNSNVLNQHGSRELPLSQETVRKEVAFLERQAASVKKL